MGVWGRQGLVGVTVNVSRKHGLGNEGQWNVASEETVG